MPVRSEVKDSEPAIRETPYLGRFKSTSVEYIVLFYGEDTGVVVWSDGAKGFPIGRTSDAWVSSNFVPLNPNETIVLQNK